MPFKTIENNIGEFYKHVLSTQNEYAQLPRRHDNVEQIIQAKFAMQGWRRNCLDLLLNFFETKPSESDFITALDALAALRIKPTPKEINALSKHCANASDAIKTRAMQLLAELNEHQALRKLNSNPPENLLKLAGPQKELPICANAPSRWTIDRWSKFDDFSNYEYKDGGILYRGLHLMPGDALLSNVNRDGNGVYTLLCEPRACAYHLGIFAIVNINGSNFPVTIEAYKLGARIIPLSTFLSANFNSYIEVIRQKNKPSNFHALINQCATTITTETKGYNFDTEDPDPAYLACTSMGNLLFKQAGGTQITTKSRYNTHPQIRKNLAAFGLTISDFLSLTDYLVDNAMEFVGAIDNNHFHTNVARELCERHFAKVLMKNQIIPAKMPPLYHLGKFAIPQMRSDTLLGRIFAKTQGFTSVSVPKGPTEILAAIEQFEHLLEASVRATAKQVAEHLRGHHQFDINTLSNNQTMTEQLDKNFAPLFKTMVPVPKRPNTEAYT
jgi:hypothetical protein